jgi:brefeldin A-inhibited guanine nucleotide-exchange protein
MPRYYCIYQANLYSYPLIENDTLARIGTSCLQQLLQNNAQKLSPQLWQRVIATFIWLFKTTTPYQLLDERLRAEVDESSENTSPSDQGVLDSLNKGFY